MVIISAILSMYIFSLVAIIVTIGGSKNRHEQQISDKAQLEYCKNLQAKRRSKKKKQDLRKR